MWIEGGWGVHRRTAANVAEPIDDSGDSDGGASEIFAGVGKCGMCPVPAEGEFSTRMGLRRMRSASVAGVNERTAQELSREGPSRCFRGGIAESSFDAPLMEHTGRISCGEPGDPRGSWPC